MLKTIAKVAKRNNTTAAALKKYSTQQKFVLFDKVKVSDKASVGIVTLNRPDKLNAMNESMAKEFTQVFETEVREAQEGDLAALVLTGAGDKAFSAGGDLDFLLERANDIPFNNSKRMLQFYSYFLNPILKVSKVPIVSAINGHAIGAGLCVALATDVRVAEKNAKMGVTFLGLGLSPGMGSTHFLPALVGHQVASYLLLTADTISGTKAKEMQLVLETIEGSENTKQRAMDIAKQIAMNPSRLATQATLQSLRVQQLERLERHLMREADSQVQCYASSELKDTVTAMKNKMNAPKKQ